MKLLFPLSRRAFAFHENVEKLFHHNRKMYLWTFTWAKPHEDDYYMACWKKLVQRFAKAYPLMIGLRVAEMHPGTHRTFGESHGLHIHALLNERINIHRLKKLTDECGFGRINVKRCDMNGGKYLAKYLTKKADLPLPKGMRSFGTIGMRSGDPFVTRVRDVRMESTFTRNVATWQQKLNVTQMTPDLIHTIYKNSELFGHWKNWPIDRMYYHGKDSVQVFAPLIMNRGKPKTRQMRALEWKSRAIAIAKKRGTICPPEAKKFFGEKPGDPPVATGVALSQNGAVHRVDIVAKYWDKFPGKTDGTRIAYYQVCK